MGSPDAKSAGVLEFQKQPSHYGWLQLTLPDGLDGIVSVKISAIASTIQIRCIESSNCCELLRPRLIVVVMLPVARRQKRSSQPSPTVASVVIVISLSVAPYVSTIGIHRRQGLEHGSVTTAIGLLDYFKTALWY
jgi:hypothetical protein